MQPLDIIATDLELCIRLNGLSTNKFTTEGDIQQLMLPPIQIRHSARLQFLYLQTWQSRMNNDMILYQGRESKNEYK